MTQAAARRSGLPREVVRWLQSLDLSFYPQNVRRDFSNGYLVAEIFSHYYPKEFCVHSFNKGTSLSAKLGNWSVIEPSLQKLNLHLTKKIIDGTIHCKPGAAELLAEEIYTILTNCRIRDGQSPDLDFTDLKDQETLSPMARCTASTAVRNNLKTTEIVAEPDIITNQRKAEVIVRRHLELKAVEKALHPGRYEVKPRSHKVASRSLATTSRNNDCFHSAASGGTPSKLRFTSALTGAAVSFKEVKVHQPARRSLINY